MVQRLSFLAKHLVLELVCKTDVLCRATRRGFWVAVHDFSLGVATGELDVGGAAAARVVVAVERGTDGGVGDNVLVCSGGRCRRADVANVAASCCSRKRVEMLA